MSERYVLDATNKSITAVMSGAAATTNPDFEATWADKTTTTFTPGGTDGAFNGATPVTIVASPAASTQRTIYSINIYNRDTAAVTIELRYVNGASTRVIKSITLAVGDQCTLDGSYDDEGNLKTVLAGVGSGTVTSVALTATPTGIFDVSGSPVTTSGTLALAMDNQTGNTVLASPANGSSGQPAFRALVDDDIPAALTLVGGTANNMPIGGSTPNSGTFTTAIADLLRLSASTILTLATGAVTATKSYHLIAAESGTADDLVTITAAGDRQFLIIQADAGDTITIKHGTGNIFLNGAADFAMSGDETVLLFYDGTNWSDVGIGGGGGSGITELTGDVTAGPGSGSVAATLVSGTNATLTTPKIITSINDTNGNEMLSMTATGSAVNNIALTNAATGGTPTIAAVGSDADVSIDLQPKGAGVIIAESALNMNDKQIQKALYADLKAAAAPANPSAGYIRVYADSGNSNHVTQRDSAGTVIDLAAGGGSAPDIYEDGVSVVTGATRFDFKDMNVENPSGTIGTLYHNLPGICEGRLTLTSGVPVTTSDVTAAGTLYFTPYKGNKVSLYDGTRWKVYTFTERSLALTLTSGSVYDVWLYDNAGTLTLETLVWTNATTRATALASQDGVPVKSGATTRRYLGTICASGTNTTEDSLLKRFVWNYYNRVERKLKVTEATDNWSYTTTSFRSWNNSTANRVEMVVGLSEEPVYLRFDGSMYTASAVTIALGIGLDSTTTEGSDINVLMNPVNTVAPVVYTMAAYFDFPGIGYHYLQLLEYGNTGVTFYGDSGDASRSQNGALGYMRA